MLSEDTFSSLLLRLYEGVSTPERLRVFLQELVIAVHASASTFRDQLFKDENNLLIAEASLFVSTGYPDEALDLYGREFCRRDIYVQGVMRKFHSAECGVSQLIVSEPERRNTEFYADYQRPFDIGPMMWAKLAEEPRHVAALSITRRDVPEEFGLPELKLVTALAPHLRQALHLYRTLHQLQGANAMLKHCLDEMEIAICMVRQDGSILRSTQGAVTLLQTRNGIWVEKGRLKTQVSREQRALDLIIATACQTATGRGMNRAIRVQAEAAGNTTVRAWSAPAGSACLVTRKEPMRALQVVVTPFCSGSLLSDPEATALIQFSDPSARPRSRAAVLRTLYELTPTESRLADLLLQGLEVRQAAERMGTTLETARFHLKRVLAKTGTRRQAELLRLMMSLPGQPAEQFPPPLTA